MTLIGQTGICPVRKPSENGETSGTAETRECSRLSEIRISDRDFLARRASLTRPEFFARRASLARLARRALTC